MASCFGCKTNSQCFSHPSSTTQHTQTPWTSRQLRAQINIFHEFLRIHNPDSTQTYICREIQILTLFIDLWCTSKSSMAYTWLWHYSVIGHPTDTPPPPRQGYRPHESRSTYTLVSTSHCIRGTGFTTPGQFINADLSRVEPYNTCTVRVSVRADCFYHSLDASSVLTLGLCD